MPLEGFNVLKAFNRVLTPTLSKMVGLSTLRTWKDHWDMYGETPTATANRDKRRRNLITRRNAGSRVMSTLQTDVLRNLVLNEPSLYLDEIQDELHTLTGLVVSRTTIWRFITDKMKWSLRIFTSRASQQDVFLRDEYKRALWQWHDPSWFVFIDETSRGAKEGRRRRGWAPRGKDNTLTEFFLGTDHTYTMLAAADIDGFILEACELVERKSSEDDPDRTKGTVDTERFLLWVEGELVPCLGQAKFNQPRSIVVMDNAPQHQDPRVVALIKAAGALVIFTAPYSPDLNPIEFAFHQYKANLRRQGRKFNPRDFGEYHAKALMSVTRSNMIAYYNKIGCLKNVPESDEVLCEIVESVALVLLTVKGGL